MKINYWIPENMQQKTSFCGSFVSVSIVMFQKYAETYLEPCQTSVIGHFGKTVYYFLLLTIFAKSCIIDGWQGPKHDSSTTFVEFITGIVRFPTAPTSGCVNTESDGWVAGGYCISENDEYLRMLNQKCWKTCGGQLFYLNFSQHFYYKGVIYHHQKFNLINFLQKTPER